MEMKSIEEVRAIFAEDRFATENGAVIDEIGDHYAKCSLLLQARHRNAMGAVMGGVSFTLADFAFAVASNWQSTGTVSLSSNITFLGVAKGKKLIAEAVCVKNGRTTSYYQIDVRDELGTLVASVTATGYCTAGRKQTNHRHEDAAPSGNA
ncbi:PaaI family thioesterase [Candidatus Soleaferrea massiliensis]|uniref:PaaI family thioesterase n=1 Tax=Candidatus Soleaferrea massiliensis TaxID=1470354 RepID=UPI003B967754